MNLFRSKYKRLRDKISTEIKVLEIKKELLKVDQAKVRITYEPEKFIHFNTEILKIMNQVEILKKVIL